MQSRGVLPRQGCIQMQPPRIQLYLNPKILNDVPRILINQINQWASHKIGPNSGDTGFFEFVHLLWLLKFVDFNWLIKYHVVKN